ncbi:MAG: hypothetical protein LBF28_00110 [Rickettsiales bacterium]|jgi:hypothetical protein|nr:hypothetical protein [Rickettsiales bacterium]
MLKAKLIMIAVKFSMGAIALGLGVWYVSSSIDGGSLGYSSMSGFLNAIGAGGGDISTANGCFLCGYIEKLFAAIGTATENFWMATVDNLWILLAVGFGIFLFYTTAMHLHDASKKIASLDAGDRQLEFASWFDKIWKQGARVMIVGALIGALGMSGTAALRGVTNITITPVMLAGAELSMAATGVSDSAKCGTGVENNDVLNPVLKPFMCVMGNLNAIMLAGAGGGFALMNYAWMDDMGGGAFTWVAGLALVIMFLIIGFDLFFQILSVVFKLVFLIIFLPLILAAGAFEGTWSLAGNVISNAIGMLVKSAVRIIAITLKVLIIYATVSYAADEYFPGPNDGYSAILPPMMGASAKNADEKTLSVMTVFAKCENVALADGALDKDKFRNCFTASRAQVERKYPGAFDFMKNGWEFLLMMIGLFLLYHYAVSPKIDKLLSSADGKEDFDYGGWIKDLGKRIWNIPTKIAENVTKGMGKKS